MSKTGEMVAALATSIIGVAIIAVLLSKNSQTVQVIGAASNAFSSALSTAISPITVSK